MLGDNIRRERLMRNLKQEYVAQKIGIKQGTYSRIETNKIIPSFPRTVSIADAIGCRVCAFCNNGAGATCTH